MNKNAQTYIGFVVLVLIVGAGFFLLRDKKENIPIDVNNNVTEVPDNITPAPEKPIETKPDANKQTGLTAGQKTLLAKLQKSVDARDFETFAGILLEVYKKEWGGIKEFGALESKLYVYATNEYWVKGDLGNSLKVSTIVYNKVPEAWRFRYLRIITLHKYGRNAFEKGDLSVAEDYANQILQMMYRPEGAHLLADVYISRIETNLKDGNMNMAKQNLDFIWDFEVSQDRRDKLNELKRQIEK